MSKINIEVWFTLSERNASQGGYIILLRGRVDNLYLYEMRHLDETVKLDFRCHSKCGTLKNLHWSMVISAEHRHKFESLHWHMVKYQYE